MEVIPAALKETQERLLYALDEETDNRGVLTMSWEKIKVSIPFQVR